MKLKKFIRFICYTKDHSLGEKIHCLNTITKIYDDEDNFSSIKGGRIVARENEIEVDIEGTDYKQFLPLHHFKVKDNTIVKKSDIEITALEEIRTAEKAQKQIEKDQKDAEKQANKDIVNDNTKTDKQRLEALISLYTGG